MRALVARDLADAKVDGLSADRRFATAYNAALQAANMAIACADTEAKEILDKAGEFYEFVEGRIDSKFPILKRASSPINALTAARLDVRHDKGEDLTRHLELERATRPGREVRRVNVDFPIDLLRAIDREAKRIGLSRQAFIKLKLADALASSR